MIFFDQILTGTSRIALKIVFPASLLTEEQRNNGITHFLEHLHFRGNAKLPQKRLYSQMETLSSPISGETTSQTMSFSFSSPKSSFKESFDLFSEFLLESQWSKEDFIKEKAVVMREIEEDGSDSFSLRMKRSFFGHDSFSLPIAGTLSNVRKMSSKSLLRWKEKIETTDNAYCFLSGAIDDSSAAYVGEKLKNGLKKPGVRYPVLPDFKISQRRMQCVRPRWNDENELAFAIFFPKKICSYFEFSLFRSAFCGGDGAILLRDLREEHALCTGIQESVYYHKDYYILTFSCIVKKQQVPRAMEDILSALLYMKNGFNENDFLQANAVYCFDFDRFEEDPEEWNDFLFDYFEATGTTDISKPQIKESFSRVTLVDIVQISQSVIRSENISVFAETYRQKCAEHFYGQLDR